MLPTSTVNIYRQVHQAVIAEDLTSSVFLKALRWLQQDRSPESVKGWLYATARSLIADYWREQTQINLLPLETAEEIPAPSPESNDEQQQLLQTSISRLLDGLPSRERDVLTLRYFQGYSAAEIGQALGISANYVRVLQLRALRHAASLETTERIVPMASPAIPYNQQALRVLELTKEEARALNHNYIGVEHLLLGILEEGSAATELTNHGLTAERARGAIVYITGYSPAVQGYTQETGYTPRMQTIFVLAAEEARRMGETAISPSGLGGPQISSWISAGASRVRIRPFHFKNIVPKPTNGTFHQRELFRQACFPTSCIVGWRRLPQKEERDKDHECREKDADCKGELWGHPRANQRLGKRAKHHGC